MSMSEKQARESFTGAAEEAFEELQAWCRAHPSYTLLELEEQVLFIRQRLMGKAMSSLVAQRKAVKPPEGVICTKCGGKMEDKGQQARTVGGPEGSVELSRTYYYCPSCKEGFFPSGPRVEVD
jgi:uncharacterized protein with PIN domain